LNNYIDNFDNLFAYRLVIAYTGAMGESDNWLEDWAKEFELSSDTLTALAQKGFSSKKTIKKLTDELIKSEFKKLPLAQSLMLLEACQSLQQGQVGASGDADGAPGSVAVNQGPPHTDADTGAGTGNHGGEQNTPGANHCGGQQTTASDTGGLTAQDIANLIQQGSSTLSGDAQHGKPLLFDPLQFDSQCKKSAFKDIRDYITLVPRCLNSNSQAESIRIGSQEFLLKDSKIPVELINISQYMEGSLRIMRDLALHENYCKEQLLEYTNYLIKISTLAQCFEWKSVLKYDQAYRKAQSETGFRWGADNSYLMQLYLKNDQTEPPSTYTRHQQYKRPNNASTVPRPNRPGDKFDPSSGKPICKKWNSASGCNFRNCKYAHICMECYTSVHTQVMHPTPASENA
jgi:hypothetical protein